MANIDDLKRSRFLAQKDVDPPVLVTITGYEEINIAVEGAEPVWEWILNFKEFEKPLILKPTNGELIKAITGSKEFSDWIGWQIVLYVEPSVSYGGKITGGIRARAPKTSARPQLQPRPQTPREQINNPPPIGEDDIPF